MAHLVRQVRDLAHGIMPVQIGQGRTSGAIAEGLLLSSHTIDTHRENIKRKLGLKNAAELNRQAVQFLIENS